MDNIIRLFLKLFRLIIGLRTQLVIAIYGLIFKNLKMGDNIKFKGTPFIRAFGKTILGDSLIFNSKTQYNTVGLYKNCSIYVANHATLHIGSFTGFSGVSLHCEKAITIGKYCKFGGNVCIWDTDFHSLNYVERQKLIDSDIKSEPIVILDNVFVGANSIILKGISIGENTIIGAGSVVSKNIPSNEIWAGNPIRFIRKINSECIAED